MSSDNDLISAAAANFVKGVETESYWSVVDAQSNFEEWADEYWAPAPEVQHDDPIIYGEFTICIRKVNDVEWEEEGAGVETDLSCTIGEEGKVTSLERFMTDLLAFTAPLASDGTVGGNIYHLKKTSGNTMHLFMGD